jgi:hypothetical protein
MILRAVVNFVVIAALLFAPVANPGVQTASADAKLEPAAAIPYTAYIEYDCTAQSDMPVRSCQALLALYNSTNGPE